MSEENPKPLPPAEHFPPKLSIIENIFLGFSRLLFLGGLFIAINQLCFKNPLFFSSAPFWAYLGFLIALIAIFADPYLRHKIFVHNARIEDRSGVEAMFVEARTVKPRLADPQKPDDYDNKKNELEIEIKRLEELGPKGWTEYQILPLAQLLVDFLSWDDLKTRVQARLDDLNDYAQGSTYQYDKEFYDERTTRINQVEDDYLQVPEGDAEAKDEGSNPLRAQLRALLEHIADYQYNWKQGSTVNRSLIIFGVLTLVFFVFIGSVPILHPLGSNTFNILHWGVFGVIGSLIVVLRDLRNSDLLEVGNTEGKKEFLRAVLGGALGFVAGILTFAMIGGELLNGHIFPEIKSGSLKSISLSIFLGIASGYAFEKVFDRLQGTVDINRKKLS